MTIIIIIIKLFDHTITRSLIIIYILNVYLNRTVNSFTPFLK